MKAIKHSTTELPSSDVLFVKTRKVLSWSRPTFEVVDGHTLANRGRRFFKVLIKLSINGGILAFL